MPFDRRGSSIWLELGCFTSMDIAFHAAFDLQSVYRACVGAGRARIYVISGLMTFQQLSVLYIGLVLHVTGSALLTLATTHKFHFNHILFLRAIGSLVSFAVMDPFPEDSISYLFWALENQALYHFFLVLSSLEHQLAPQTAHHFLPPSGLFSFYISVDIQEAWYQAAGLIATYKVLLAYLWSRAGFLFCYSLLISMLKCSLA